MATIQLNDEILEAERLIDERSRDAAFERLNALRDRLGRRPEMRYLQLFYEAAFEKRPDQHLIADLNALVIEQPDFLEAVSVLAWLLARTGDRMRATVFAREALLSNNPSARRRAKKVLGRTSEAPGPNEPLFPIRSTAPPPPDPSPAKPTPGTQIGLGQIGESPNAVHAPSAPPAFAPPPATGDTAFEPVEDTNPFFSLEDDQSARNERTKDRLALPSQPPLQSDSAVDPFGQHVSPPRTPAPSGAKSPSAPSAPPGVIPGPAQDSQLAPSSPNFGELLDDPLDAQLSQPVLPVIDPDSRAGSPPKAADDGPMPPPPTISADRVSTNSAAVSAASTPTPSDIPGFRPVQRPTTPPPFATPAPEDEPSWPDHDEPENPSWNTGSLDLRRYQKKDPAHRSSSPSSPSAAARAAARTLPRAPSRSSSSPARPVPPAHGNLRAWFKFAAKSQLKQSNRSTTGGVSTSATLLALAERVVEGTTPLSGEPVPLDRRGLIIVQQRLEQVRNNRRSTSSKDRVLVTASAAFLLAVLLKECEGVAIDIAPEDGGCKVVLPSGATLRPLLVSATFLRSRGPGLVDSFDRVATAHMRRSSRTSGRMRKVTPSVASGYSGQRVASSVTGAPYLSSPIRDLDAGTLAVITDPLPRLAPPSGDMAAVAREFWASELGHELKGMSERIGRLTIADVDVIESYISRVFDASGSCPPGQPWPWNPTQDQVYMIESWGAVLGEVLISLYGGRWEADPAEPNEARLFRVVLSGGVVSWPVTQVYLRLSRGIVHDLAMYVDVVGRMAGLSTARR